METKWLNDYVDVIEIPTFHADPLAVVGTARLAACQGGQGHVAGRDDDTAALLQSFGAGREAA
jgi:hypothetical protein